MRWWKNNYKHPLNVQPPLGKSGPGLGPHALEGSAPSLHPLKGKEAKVPRGNALAEPIFSPS